MWVEGWGAGEQLLSLVSVSSTDFFLLLSINLWMDAGQVAKLERHLSLLRQEYVKLQNKLVDLEQKYSVAIAASGQTGEHENTFVSRLLKTVAELFDKDLYRCKGLLLYLRVLIIL